MASKSIHEIQIDDAQFLRFNALFEKYNTAVKQQPAHWAKITNSIKNNAQGFQAVVNAIVAQTAVLAQVQTIQGRITAQTNQTAGAWKLISLNTKQAAGNIKSITLDILRWTGVTGGLAGLLGIGSAWGLDRLASSVTGARRGALGLGVGYGEFQAFGPSFGRFLDPGAFLGGISGALYDQSNPAWRGLIAAGVRPGTTDDAAQVGVQLLTRLPQLFANIPKNWRGTYAQNLGLGELGLSTQDINRILGAQPGERAALIKQYTGASGALNVSPHQQKAWNDFLTTLDISGRKIETVFVKGLSDLTGPLGEVSNALADFVKTLLSQPELKTWIHEVAAGIGEFAKEVTTPQFKQGVLDFVHGVYQMGKAIGAFVDWVGGGSKGSWADFFTKAEFAAGGAVAGAAIAGPLGAVAGGVGGWALGGAAVRAQNNIARHNPGGLRMPGQSTGFASFPSDNAGVSAIARQIMIYGSRDHLNTIAAIISKYAPSNENNTAAYIGDVVRMTGFRANQHLNLSDPNVLAALVSAITRHEHIKQYSQGAVKNIIEINNNTGAQVTQSAVQLGGQP